jgi:hypothetical protein
MQQLVVRGETSGSQRNSWAADENLFIFRWTDLMRVFRVIWLLSRLTSTDFRDLFARIRF